MRTTVLLLSLSLLFFSSYCREDNVAAMCIESQLSTIRDVLVNGTIEDRKFLIYSLPEMPGKWEEIFAVGNYEIKSAQREKGGSRIFGVIDFLFPNGKIRAFTYVTLTPERRSKTGFTMSITADQCKKPNDLRRLKREFYADDDCAWWGCIDG